jgi:hypothetical protein
MFLTTCMKKFAIKMNYMNVKRMNESTNYVAQSVARIESAAAEN